MKLAGALVTIFLLIQMSTTYKILGVFPTTCKSHWIIGHSVMKTLAHAGHEVHVISPFPLKTPIDNYIDIEMEEHVNIEQAGMFDTKQWTPLKMMHFLSDLGEFNANATLAHPNVQKMLTSGTQFDLVIVEIFWFESLYGLGVKLDCPVIALSTFGTSKWTNDLTMAPMEYSYVPQNFVKLSHDMNFWERTQNMIVSHYENIFMNWVHYRRQRAIYNQFFDSRIKSFDDQMKSVSLVFIYNHFSFSSLRPITANMIEIGGLHVEPVKPLPQDIQNFLDSATDGAIVFSMGSIISATDWPPHRREAFVRSFAKLPQKVIWKYENDTLPGNKPDNVMLQRWLPQRDILAHPNIRLFITHGGLLGTTEAIVEGVPVLGIPIYSDQQMNMIQAENFGMGIMMDFDEINEELITKNVDKLLQDPKYRENAQKISKWYNDRPQSIQDTTTYWVEYVIRHKGASHFHSPAHKLNYFQLNLIDSYAFLAAILFITLYAVCKFLSRLKIACKDKGEKMKKT